MMRREERPETRPVVFAHGFGVRGDDRGLFPDLAAVLDRPSVMSDLVDVDGSTLTVVPLREQARRLDAVIDAVPLGEIDLVAHSQGCLAAALVASSRIRRAVLIAPPVVADADVLLTRMGGRTGTTISRDGISRLARRDGSTTLVPSAFWDDLDRLEPIGLYRRLASSTSVLIVHALADEVLGPVSLAEEVPAAETVSMAGDHDFTGAARPVLARLVETMLSNPEGGRPAPTVST